MRVRSLRFAFPPRHLALAAVLTGAVAQGLPAQPTETPRPPAPSTPSATPSPDQEEDRLIEMWARMSPPERMQKAVWYFRSRSRPPRRESPDPVFELFTRTIRQANPRDRMRFQRGGRSPERVRRLLDLTDRYVRGLYSRRMLREIPRRLESMEKAGLISEAERKGVESIQVSRRKEKAYFDLRDEVFLRQMRKAGRIDEDTYRRISALKPGRTKRRELERLRQIAFFRINAHLLHFLLKPAERVALQATRLTEAFHVRVERLERRMQVRFLPVFASPDHDRLSHLLRMSADQEQQMFRRDISPEERAEAALEIFRQQREKLVAALEARIGRERSRFIAAEQDPRIFYQRAFRMLRVLGDPVRGGDARFRPGKTGRPPGSAGPPSASPRRSPGAGTPAVP